MRFSYFFPIRNIGKEDACTNDIFERSSGPLERTFNILKNLNRLRVRIACDDLPIHSSRGLPATWTCAPTLTARE